MLNRQAYERTRREPTVSAQIPGAREARQVAPAAIGPKPPPPAGNTYGGWVGFVVLFVFICWIGHFAGCGSTETGRVKVETRRPATDSSLRYVGALGAVAGYDNLGGTTRLAPGTALRASGGSYMDPIEGPKKIYVVTEGELRGMQVPLSEGDLEPQ